MSGITGFIQNFRSIYKEYAEVKKVHLQNHGFVAMVLVLCQCVTLEHIEVQY